MTRPGGEPYSRRVNGSALARPPAVSPRRAVFVLLAVAFAARAIPLALTYATPPVRDEKLFVAAANRVLDHTPYVTPPTGFDEAHYAPLHPLFMAGVLAISNRSLVAVKFAQVILGVATVWLSYRIGRRLLRNDRAALAGAFAIALLPELIAFTHFVWTETLFTTLFAAGFLSLLRVAETRSRRDAAIAGALLGAATLAKEIALPFLVMLLPWFVDIARPSRRRAAELFAICMLACALVIAPVTLRNWLRYDRFMLVSTNIGFALQQNQNAFPAENYDWGRMEPRPPAAGIPVRARCTDANIADRMRCEVRGGLAFMARHPALVARRAVTKLAALWTPSNFLIRHLRARYYKPPPGPFATQILTTASTAAFIALSILAVAGLFASPAGAERRLTFALLIFYVIIHAVIFGMSRYRIPLLPILFAYAGLALTAPRATMRAIGRSRGNFAAAAAILVLMSAAWARDLPHVLDVWRAPFGTGAVGELPPPPPEHPAKVRAGRRTQAAGADSQTLR
ncbi:MAG: ArnT family glycosyltransferase [bacterium]